RNLRARKPLPECVARRRRNYDGGQEDRKRRQAALEVRAFSDLHAGEAQTGSARIRLHAPEPNHRAAGHPGHSRNGGEGTAFGGNSKLAVSYQLSAIRETELAES